MSLHALRRRIARHPLAWVLGLALALVGAQAAATAHEFSHVAAASARADLHANAQHDCPTCLLAAALGGAATASPAVALAAPRADAPVAVRSERRFTPRITHPYASRAPPAPPVSAA